jgi:hypothetical protein
VEYGAEKEGNKGWVEKHGALDANSGQKAIAWHRHIIRTPPQK